MILLILNSYVLCIVIIIRHKRIPVSCFSFYYALVKINMAFRKNPSTDEVLPNVVKMSAILDFSRKTGENSLFAEHILKY